MRTTIRFGKSRSVRLIAVLCVVIATAVGFVGPVAAAHGEEGAVRAVPGQEAPVHGKHATANGDGTYTLSMDVKGGSTEQEQQQVIPLEVVLVLDVSGSMDGVITRGLYQGRTRLWALQDSVKWFLRQIGEENRQIQRPDDRIRVSLVKYAGESTDRIGNDTYRLRGSTTSYNYSQTVSPLTSDTDRLIGMVDQLRAAGPTRTDLGMRHAADQLGGARANARRVAIVYSDGQPTTWAEDFNYTVANAALQSAVAIKRMPNSTIFSIGVRDDVNNQWALTSQFMNYTSSNYPDVQSMPRTPWPPASGPYYYSITDDTNLRTIFENIVSIVVTGTAYQDVKMTDTLSTYAEFAMPDEPNFGSRLVIRDAQGKEVPTESVGLGGNQGDSYTIAADPASKTISVAFPEGYVMRDGYTYSLEYRIRPSTEAYERYAANVNAGIDGYGERPAVGEPGTGESSAGKEGFLSNKKATLDYTPRVNGKPASDPQTSEFPHPVIQVDGSKLTRMTIRKHWEGIAELPQSILVNVECSTGGSQPCTSYTDLELTAGPGGGDWQRDVVIPVSGVDRSYTVTEHGSGNYYTRYDDKRVWNLKAGESAPAGGYVTIITNYPRTGFVDLHAIRIGKTVVGMDLGAQGKFDFTLRASETQGVTKDGMPFTSTSSSITGPFENGRQKTGSFSGRVSVPLPSPEEQERRYSFVVSEVDPASGQWEWDRDHVGVTVSIANTNGGMPLFNDDNTVRAAVTYAYQAGDADGAASNSGLAAFTNTVKPVSKLPLTGENGATPLLWAGVGGGLGALALLLAGGAAVLQRRRPI